MAGVARVDAYPSNSQSAAQPVPPPCHVLLMSLSLTQLLVHRLDVINLLKEECWPAINCLHRWHSIHCCYIVTHHLSSLVHIFFSILDLPISNSFSWHVSIHSPSLTVPDTALILFPLSLSRSLLSISVALPKHEFFICSSHVSRKLQGRQTWQKQAQDPWRTQDDGEMRDTTISCQRDKLATRANRVIAGTAAWPLEDEHKPKHKLWTRSSTLWLWS